MVDGTEPEAWIAKMVQDAQQKADRVNAAVIELQQRTFTAHTQDRSVTVTVNHAGAVTGIQLTDAMRDRDPKRLSAELIDCIQRAGLLASSAAQDGMRPVLKDQPETLAALRESSEQQTTTRATPTASPRRPDDPDDDYGDRSWMRR